MCGIFGFVNPEGISAQEGAKRFAAALESMSHRGPDGEGLFTDEKAGVVLGHRRLAIIDPAHGHQPMATPDGDLTVTFNGEIYNYLELRRELLAKGHAVQSYGDTEVILHAYREWGEACVERFLGMFAFAIWDKKKNKIFCARDRIGIKPFYYAQVGETLAFASEIKAILATGLLRGEVCREGVQDYMAFQFCLGEKTLFEGVRKLEPGCTMTIALKGKKIKTEIKQYWDVSFDADEEHDEAWFVDNLSTLIEDAVRMHLRSDVPLGAHLSGGLDSSAIVCLASRLLGGEKLQTFTGAFTEGPKFDETSYAKQVAEATGATYNEIYIPGSEFADILPKLMHYADEPSAGPGLVPQYFVSKLAAEKVKVVLGGQGGDEIFIGYARYLVAYLEKCLNGAIYQTADKSKYAVSLESIVPNLPLLQTYRPMLQSFWRDGLFEADDKRYFRLIDRSEGMVHLISKDVAKSDYSPFESFRKIFNRKDLHSFVNQMTYFDLKGSLPSLLHVEDRVSMAVSIESRVPLLDHRIIEFMAKIPPNIKFAGGRMKHLFKESIKNTVPEPILNRKDKMGFPTPIAHWAKGVAKDFVYDTLLSGRARQRGFFNAAEVENALRNETEFGRAVWGLLCLELWHQSYIDSV